MDRFLKSPVHICLLGALVLSAGIHSAVVMASGWIQGNVSLNFGVLLIFIGLGLLRGSNLQRSLFGGFLALSLAGAAIVLVIFVFSKSFSKDAMTGLGIAMVVFFFLVLVYFFYVLWSARGDEWFAQKYSGKSPPYVIPVVVVLTVLFSIGSELEKYNRQASWDQIYHYEVEIRPVDSETGKTIKHVSIAPGDQLSSDQEIPGVMRVSSTGTRHGEGTIWQIEGFSDAPFEVALNHEDYKSQLVTVDRSTGNQIEVKMVRSKK